MRKLQIKFPSQIRISGWDFGSSARAMNQAGGKDGLMTYEQRLSAQADLRTVRKSTTERKSMSTKTSIKRIALVAVAALGFGVFTTVTPANAAEVTSANITSVAITADTRVVRSGSSISLAAAFVAAAGAGDDETVLLKAQFSAQPAGSSANVSFTSANRSVTTDDSGAVTYTASAAGSIASLLSTPDASDAFGAATQTPGSISFTPSVAGTYELVLWHDRDGDDFLDSTEDYDTETISVAGAPSAIAFTKYGSGVGIAAAAGTVATYTGNHGVLIKVNIKDSAALNSGLAAGEYIRVTPSTATGDIMAVNGTAVTYTPGTTTYYDLTYGDFNTSGNAFINVADSAAETLTLTLSGGGTAISSLAAATTATYKTYDSDGNFSVLPTNCASSVGFEANTSPDFYVPLTSASSTICALGSTDFTAEAYGAVTVSDTSGKITAVDGSTSYTNDLAYTEAVLTDTDKEGSITVSHTFTAASQAFQIDVVTSGTGTSDGDYTSKAREVNSSSVTASPDVVRAATSSSVSITANVVDNFGSNLEAAQVVMTVSGRNSTATATKSSDSKGNAVFTLADAPAAGVTAVVDTVTFTAYYGAASDTGSAQVTWGGYTITTLTLTTDGDTDTVAGTTKTAIATGVAGATGTLGSTSATVKDANGLVLAGVPVTFTIAGTGCAIPSDKATVYTSAAGVAASNFYGWTVGSCVITATAGAVSATDTVYFKQEDAASARTISVAAAGNVVTATVKDRYGNGVKGATVWATRTGSGYFGTGSSATSGTTDVNGNVEFLVTPGTAETVVTVQLGSTSAASATYGQSADAAGYIGGNATTGTAVTAYVAGTSVTREVGVGSSLAPAGVNTATVTLEGATSGTSDAIDAANEATDAANAATDAANAAAEAADAATAAAQDAQAAVAALATEVAAMISGIKAQIIRLTNLVVKIQKKVKA